jgi:predicted dehydrogenase
MVDKVRIGFIGAGGMARSHVKRLMEIPEAELVALTDPSEASIARMVADYPHTANLPVFRDHREMLAQVELDAVQIHSPHTQHFAQGMDVLAAGKHLLMEKPLVCTTRDAHAIIAAGQGKVFMISYQRHLQGPYMYIREQIQSGALGNLQYIAALQSQGWLRGTKGTWRQSLALSGGGQLNDSGSHLVDILLWTTGLTAESVFAFSQNYDTEVDIDSALSLRFTNGAQGTISIIGDSPMWWEEFTVWGSGGVLLYRNGKIMQRAFGATEMTEVTALPPDSTPDRNWVDAILGRDTVRVPPECGLRTIELTEAAWRSAKLGRPVRVSELA